MNNKSDENKITTNDSCNSNTKENDIMPTIELVEKERMSYIEEMEEYLKKLQTMPKDEAIELSKKNLIEAGILDENCKLTEHYRIHKDTR